MNLPWVAIDTETTGLEPGSRLIELAAVRFALHDADEAAEPERFTALVRPPCSVPPDVTTITGIDDAMLVEAETAEQVLPRFLTWLGDKAMVVAHNAGYDVNLIGWECDHAGLSLPRWRVVDSVAFARSLGTPGGLSLAAQVAHYGIDTGPAHRALPDAEATMALTKIARAQLTPERFAAIAQGNRLRGRWRHVRELPAPFDIIPRLMADQQRLRFRYTDRAGRVSEREISPYGYAMVRGRLRFHGYCHLRHERRNFAAERAELCP
ncbi:MAG: exonuclease domain-containing protein [Planctomycetota bacterium]|jgi:DNA polymerase III epsilon subunit-like protein|nr:exonuclease domain-containing protein [Planctomycetota bacterium]